MIEFLEFSFSGDKFYQKETLVPLQTKGLTLLRGKNYDASSDGQYTSNGACKTRLIELLVSFIYGRSPRGTFKRSVGIDFKGKLSFKTKDDVWQFSYEPSKAIGAWSILKNDQEMKVSHKASDCQELLQQVLGLSKEDFNYFVFINQQSLNTLIKGKPSEKKAYLEGFFNIDSFYTQNFNVYNQKLKSMKNELENIRHDRIRLDSVMHSVKELAGKKWLELQIENCDSALSLIKEQITEKTKYQTEVAQQIDIWSKYHALFATLQNLNADTIKIEYDSLVKRQMELEQKEKSRLALEKLVRLKLNPHLACKPKVHVEHPSEDKPDNKIITEKEVALTQMKEKLNLKKQIIPIEKEIADLQTQIHGISSQDLSDRKASLYKERVDAEAHYKLLQKGGDSCPTCKQPLTFILNGMSLQERMENIEAKIKKIVEEEKDCMRLMSLQASMLKSSEKLNVLRDQFSRYPTFGVKLSLAEEELSSLKHLASQWERYEREQKALKDWETTYNLLLMEANNLGYPDLLQETFTSELAAIAQRIPALLDDLKLFDQFDILTDKVINFLPLPDLKENEKECRDDVAILLSRVESLNEFKGVLKTQLSSLISLQAQIDTLRDKVATQKDKESEYKILELMNNFYSPSGFKVYELKKRCQRLIDRSNFWSKLFFQESYTWSLSDDMENLDFYIQPSQDPDTEPYSIAYLSAGEFNRAARVLLFSQLELIPPNKKTNLLFLDEIEGHLDQAGMTAFVEVVLPKLKETFPDYTIVVISHLPSLHNAGVLDHMWLVERRHRKATLSVHTNYAGSY